VDEKGCPVKVSDAVYEFINTGLFSTTEIGGHTDSSGSESFNQKLSEDRAKSEREYLLENFPKLDPSFLRSAGYGESQPDPYHFRRTIFLVMDSLPADNLRK
jgi:outer membrane protein OmpA-like peptidoglycan-associated protein